MQVHVICNYIYAIFQIYYYACYMHDHNYKHSVNVLSLKNSYKRQHFFLYICIQDIQKKNE
jgi:hypothetical protein